MNEATRNQKQANGNCFDCRRKIRRTMKPNKTEKKINIEKEANENIKTYENKINQLEVKKLLKGEHNRNQIRTLERMKKEVYLKQARAIDP